MFARSHFLRARMEVPRRSLRVLAIRISQFQRANPMIHESLAPQLIALSSIWSFSKTSTNFGFQQIRLLSESFMADRKY